MNKRIAKKIAMSDEEQLFDDEQMEAGQPALSPNQPKRSGKKTKPHRSPKHVETGTGNQVTEQFAACGRCSYFWAGYKLIDQAFMPETAVDPEKPGWLTLTSNHAVRDLVYKSFGNRLDLEFYHYEGCCPGCQRPFIFHGGNGDEPSFRIRL
ncbi:MAG: hypothetical protein KC423_10430 [Anaerolineales bacterium]|nr:hypothetical protein [Anaerolineales bacterium]